MTAALPLELIDNIFSFCDGRTLKSCRLASRPFSKVATEYAFETVHLALIREKLENFMSITSHPVLSKHVKHLVFHGQLPARISSFREYERLVDLRFDLRPRDPLLHIRPRHNMSHAQLRRHWLQYRDFMDTTEEIFDYLIGHPIPNKPRPEIFAVRRICDNFANAVSKLSNLESATLSAYHSKADKHPFWWSIQEKILLMPYQWRRYVATTSHQADPSQESVVQLTMLLKGLAKLRHTGKLEALNIETRSMAFWRQDFRWLYMMEVTGVSFRKLLKLPWYKKLFASMNPAFSTIAHLRLSVDYNLGHEDSVTADQVSRFLHQANSLVSLDLSFEDNWGVYHYEDLLVQLRDVSWPQLRELSLKTMTSSDGIMGFLRAVASTLKELNLHGVKLNRVSGPWDVIFLQIPEFLKLERASLCDLQDTAEPDADDYGMPMTYKGRTLFSQAMIPIYPHHHREMCRYLTRETTIMPSVDMDEFLEEHQLTCAECSSDQDYSEYVESLGLRLG